MSIPTAERLVAVEEYYFSTKLRKVAAMIASGRPVLNIGIGNPDLPPPPQVLETLASSCLLPEANTYQPYRGIPELRDAIAQWYARHFDVYPDVETEVLPLIGSKEGVFYLSMAFLNPCDVVLVPDPGYPGYAGAAKIAGANVVTYDLEPENGWLPNLNEIDVETLHRTKMMWINYPHMPTGAYAQAEHFDALIELAHNHNILLCNDNPYSMILNAQAPLSLLSRPMAKDVCVELNSLSKVFHMPGWRVGMMLGATEHIDAVLKVKTNVDSGMFRPIQLAAVEALNCADEWVARQRIVYEERRTVVYEFLNSLDCRYEVDQAGLFVWAKIPDWADCAKSFAENLLQEKDIFVAPGDVFGNNGDRYIRVSICAPKSKLIEAHQRVTDSVGAMI